MSNWGSDEMLWTYNELKRATRKSLVHIAESYGVEPDTKENMIAGILTVQEDLRSQR